MDIIGTIFCELILNRVDEAIKERQLGPIWKGLRMDNPDIKRAILDKLLLDDPAYKFLGAVVHNKEEFEAEDRFRSQVSDMIIQMGAHDPVIMEYLESMVPAHMEKHTGPMGSGPDGKPLEHYFCANVHLENLQFCRSQGTRNCAACGLVAYCSKECQTKHWSKHKTSCKKSQFRDAVWKPELEADNQSEEVPDSSIPLWRTTPALDVINFAGNEFKDDGVSQEQMRIVFPASGDFGSLVETLASVPVSYDRAIDVVINDKEPMIVARNLIMSTLLLLKGEEAIDAVINLWYSAAITQEQHIALLSLLEKQLKASKKRATISSRKSSIQLNNIQQVVQLVLRLFKNDLEVQEALDLRTEVMLNPDRKPQVDGKLLALKEFHRESVDRFRRHGLLLPYESLNAHVNQYNKFLFSPGVGWLLSDMADPKEGWDMVRVMEFGDMKHLPKNDLYGRLFFYVRDRLSKMVATMERIPVKIRFFQKNAGCLAAKFMKEKLSFDRVDASNIDIAAALSDWAPLLNKSNPHSALITLSLDWNDGTAASDDDEVAKLARDFLGISGSSSAAAKCESLMPAAIGAFTDNATTFEEYLEKVVKKKPQGVRRRMKHSILPYHIMFPLDAPVDATLDCLEKEKQYCVFNWSKHQVNRYVEWGF